LFKQNGFLIPEWRRKGIGQALLLWMENHLRDRVASLPPKPAQYYQINVSQFQPGKAIMVERAGYQPVRYFYTMVRPSLEDIPAFRLPDGLEVRPARPEHYPAIWKSIDETSQDEWGYSQPTEADYQRWLADAHFQPDLWQVAWDLSTNQVAGHVCTFIDRAENEQFNRKRGYTEGVGVDRAWRGRGLARALISRSLQAQKDAGMTESALAVDGDHAGVTNLYESCGFQIVSRDTIYRKPLEPASG
jgi:mycothiol synthase